jgi:hypothetical protein
MLVVLPYKVGKHLTIPNQLHATHINIHQGVKRQPLHERLGV